MKILWSAVARRTSFQLGDVYYY